MSLNLWRRDPGPCPICGAAHTACTDGRGDEIVQMPLRDAAVAAAAAKSKVVGAPTTPPLDADRAQATLPPGEFTTGNYRGGFRGNKLRAGASTPPTTDTTDTTKTTTVKP